MRVVKPYARMRGEEMEFVVDGEGTVWPEFTRTQGINKLRRVEYAARVSHRTEDKITPDSYDRFLRSVVLQHGDWSVTEHEKVTCEFLVDRGVTHEIVRHRIGSYTQESTRFVNYQKSGGEAKFIKPPTELLGTWGVLEPTEFCPTWDGDVWERTMELYETAYMNALRSRPEASDPPGRCCPMPWPARSS